MLDHGMSRYLNKTSMKMLMDAGDLSQGVRGFMKIKTGKSGSTGHGICRVAVAVGKGSGEVVTQEGIEEIIRGDRDGKRQDPPGDPLRETDQIRNKARLLKGKKTPRPAEAGHHLVIDHWNSTLAEKLAELL